LASGSTTRRRAAADRTLPAPACDLTVGDCEPAAVRAHTAVMACFQLLVLMKSWLHIGVFWPNIRAFWPRQSPDLAAAGAGSRRSAFCAGMGGSCLRAGSAKRPGFDMPPLTAYVEWVRMPSSAPADSAVSSRYNLPAEVTGLIGRERDIADIKQLAGRMRLPTLTGVGGTGKTRLALRVAAGLLPGFPDGAWLVQLAPWAGSGLSADFHSANRPPNLGSLPTGSEGCVGSTRHGDRPSPRL